jgi:serine protease
MRRIALAALAFAAVSTSSFALDATFDSVAVRFRDDVKAVGSDGPRASIRAALSSALGMPFSYVGVTNDGAWKFAFAHAVGIGEARAALNRVRMLPGVLYAAAKSSGDAEAAKAAAPASGGPPVRRIIVKYRDPAISATSRRNEALPPGLLARIASVTRRATAHERAMSGGAFVVRLFDALAADQAVAAARALQSDPNVEYAEPDLLKQPTATPNDPLYPQQWHYQSPPAEMGGVDLPPAWDVTTGSSSVTVGVIDTGILPHPDLVGRYVAGYDMISDPLVANDQDPPGCVQPGTCSSRDANASDPGDWVTPTEDASGYFQGCGARNSSFHGTHVAGTIGAASNNGTGVTGIGWNTQLLPVRALGKCGGYTSDIADAIVWASGGTVPGVPANPTPARVLNLSLAGASACDAASQNAINVALNAGTAVVVAAGNGDTDASTSSPGNCNGVITVAAIGRQGQRASYTNYGANVEISAPGGSDGAAILSTINTGVTSPDPAGYSYAWYQGTSMATPHVAGVAALMLAVNPALTPAQLLALMQASARPFPAGTIRDCTTSLCGAGIVDAAAAVRAAQPANTGSGLANGGFEAPVLAESNYLYDPTGGGWTFSGGSGIQRNGSAWGAAGAPEGQQTAFLQGGNAQVAQTIALTAGTYVVSFAAARRWWQGDAQPLQISIDGVPIGATIAPVDTNFARYTSASFSVGTGSHTLAFTSTNFNGDNTTFIDAVRVDDASAASGSLADAGFESPSVDGSGYQYNPAGGNWTFEGGSGIQRNGSAWGAAGAPDGQQTAFLQQGNARVAQTLTLRAGTYVVSFAAARRWWQGDAQPLQISIDGVPVGAPIAPVDTNFARYASASFSVGAGSHTLAFTSTNPDGDNTTFIDAVSIDAQ